MGLLPREETLEERAVRLSQEIADEENRQALLDSTEGVQFANQEINNLYDSSPDLKNDLTSCLAHANTGDAVLLIEDGVYGAISGTDIAQQISSADASIYVLGGDLAARGIASEKITKGIKVVDYDGFVDLTTEHSAVNSWL